jgi:hypothetical protein
MPRTARLEIVHAPSLPRSLDDLADLDCDALLALYRQGSTPAISAVVGDPARPHAGGARRGRATVPAAAGLRAVAFLSLAGQELHRAVGDRGRGHQPVFSDRRPSRWFRFATRIQPSRAGAFDAFQLDYDNPDNPFFIRAIKDEIREVSPGLYLGQAYVVIGGKPGSRCTSACKAELLASEPMRLAWALLVAAAASMAAAYVTLDRLNLPAPTFSAGAPGVASTARPALVVLIDGLGRRRGGGAAEAAGQRLGRAERGAADVLGGPVRGLLDRGGCRSTRGYARTCARAGRRWTPWWRGCGRAAGGPRR